MMDKWLIFVMLIAAALALPQQDPDYNYDYTEGEEDLEEEEGDYDDVTPEFLVEGQHVTAKEGENIVIPCRTNPTPYALLIKKETADQKKDLLFVDHLKVRRERRYKLNGDVMEISNLRRDDAGTYICVLQSTPPLQISHVLEVEYSPIVTAVNKVKRVRKGESVKLDCHVQGNPAPTINWSKQGGRLPSGEKEEEGLSMTFVDVDRHIEGNYVCTADNGIGQPDSAVTSIIVQYKPEITTKTEMIETSTGSETVELVCIVHAKPAPAVRWTKDGKPLSLGDHVEKQRNGGHRSVIRMTRVTEQDFGDYVCAAENKFGPVESTISFTGVPKPPHFTSTPNGGEDDSYTLTWDTESFYPVTDYRLLYKKAEADDEASDSDEWTGETFEVSGNLETNGLVHSMTHILSDLESDTDYIAMVQVKNQYNWGDSAQFAFSTKKEEEDSDNTNGAYSASVSSVALILASALLARILGHC